MLRPALRWAAFRCDAAFRSGVPAVRRFGVEQCSAMRRSDPTLRAIAEQ
jgi:hypothetical protein